MMLERQRNPNLDVALKQLLACLSHGRSRRVDDVVKASAMIGSDWPDPVVGTPASLTP